MFHQKEIYFLNEDTEVPSGAVIGPKSYCWIERVQVQNSGPDAPVDLLGTTLMLFMNVNKKKTFLKHKFE